jgi:hypothetical protein
MVGTLPRPRTTLEGIEYYVEAFRTDGRALRTPIFRPRVVAGPGACPGVAAPSAGVAASVLLPPPGAPPFPAGFRSGAEKPRAAPALLPTPAGAPPGVAGTGSEAGSSGFPVRWLIGAVAAGGAVGALVARNRGGAPDAAPSGDASSPEGIAGSWLAQMSGVRRVGESDCRLTATLILDFQDPVGGELAGSAVATVLILEPAGCSHAVAVGQTGALVGKTQGDDLSFNVEGPPGKPPYAFDGTVRGDSLEGTVSQREVDDEGLLSGSWTAARR